MNEQAEQLKAGVQAKVKYPFRVIKRHFGHIKLRYRRLAKSATHHAVCAVQHLNGSLQPDAGGAGMCAPANSQQAVKGLKNDLLPPLRDVIDAAVQQGGIFAYIWLSS